MTSSEVSNVRKLWVIYNCFISFAFVCSKINKKNKNNVYTDPAFHTGTKKPPSGSKTFKDRTGDNVGSVHLLQL